MRYTKIGVLVVVLGVVPILNGCSSSGSPTTPIFPDFQYPLELGISWAYDIRWAVYMTPSDSASPVDSFVTSFRSEVRCDRYEELEGRGQLVVLEENLSSTDETYWGEVLLRNETKGLFQYAYRGTSFRATPKTGRKNLTLTNLIAAIPSCLPIGPLSVNVALTGASSNTLYVEEKPVLLLAYPLRLRDSWRYRENDAFRIHRRVTGIDTVNTPAGQYVCAVIEYLYDFDSDGQWEEDFQLVDYIAEIGLVKRELKVLNELWTGDSGETLGTINSIEIALLVQPPLN